MKIFSTILTLCVFSLSQVLAQLPDSAWEKGAVVNIGLTNAQYSKYWQAGGIDAISIVFRFNGFANLDHARTSWQNDLALGYGVIRQGEGGDESAFIKNEDRIEINSKYGYKLTEKLLLSSLLNFRTQFAKGFAIDPAAPTQKPDPANAISDIFSPAYLNFGVGLDWQPSKNFSLYYTPINSKVTIVSDEGLRPNYIPQDITTGAVRYELGSLLNMKFRRELAKNLLFQTNASFFLNYLQSPTQVDVNWETLTTAKVNDWLAVSFSTNLIYDKDIVFVQDDPMTPNVDETIGNKVQFQNVLSVGITWNLLN